MSNEKKQDDILSKFIENETKSNLPNNNTKLDDNNDNNLPKDYTKSSENYVYGREYFSIDTNLLPTGIFYKPGTKISIRAASVADVQEYSVVDDSNIMDVTEKMNLILSRCVRYTHPNGLTGTYKDIKDSDRLVLIFMIRELTFQKGNNLAKDVTCKYCNHDFKIEFRSTHSQTHHKTFVYYELDDELKDFLNPVTNTIDIEINNKLWKLSPPTIGLQEIFFSNIKNKVQEDNNPNISFLKIIPFTLWNMNKISEDGIKAKEKEFKSMDMETFQTLNYIVDKMKFGIKELTDKCPVCGGEVHSDMSFPRGASNIFIIPRKLDKFKKK